MALDCSRGGYFPLKLRKRDAPRFGRNEVRPLFFTLFFTIDKRRGQPRGSRARAIVELAAVGDCACRVPACDLVVDRLTQDQCGKSRVGVPNRSRMQPDACALRTRPPYAGGAKKGISPIIEREGAT
jgi:hypothetical protein